MRSTEQYIHIPQCILSERIILNYTKFYRTMLKGNALTDSLCTSRKVIKFLPILIAVKNHLISQTHVYNCTKTHNQCWFQHAIKLLRFPPTELKLPPQTCVDLALTVNGRKLCRLPTDCLQCFLYAFQASPTTVAVIISNFIHGKVRYVI